MPRSQRIEGLDLLRGVAIGLVMVRHGWSHEVGGAGIVGVVMFFALSGYLITGVLADQVTREGRPDLRRFYRDRALRLLPALLLLLAVFSAMSVFGGHDGGRTALSVSMALTYTADVPLLVARAAPELGHLWTLSVEEQFYLVWPLLLMTWHRRTRRGARMLSLLLALYSLLLMGVLAGAEPRDAYVLPTSWAVVLLIGAIARLHQDRVASLLPKRGAARMAASGIALAVLLVIASAPDLKNWTATYLVLGPLIGVATVVLIFHLREWKQIPREWLRPLLWLGTVSYAAYLWNNAIVVWMGGAAMRLSWLESLLSLALTVAAAQTSQVLVERPVARWKAARRIRTAVERDEHNVAQAPAVVARTRSIKRPVSARSGSAVLPRAG